MHALNGSQHGGCTQALLNPKGTLKTQRRTLLLRVCQTSAAMLSSGMSVQPCRFAPDPRPAPRAASSGCPWNCGHTVHGLSRSHDV